MRIESFHGTDPLIVGKEYYTFVGSKKITGILRHCDSTQYAYLVYKIYTGTAPAPEDIEEPPFIMRHLIVDRLLLFPVQKEA